MIQYACVREQVRIITVPTTGTDACSEARISSSNEHCVQLSPGFETVRLDGPLFAVSLRLIDDTAIDPIFWFCLPETKIIGG